MRSARKTLHHRVQGQERNTHVLPDVEDKIYCKIFNT